MNNRSLKIRDPFREIRDLERRLLSDFFAPGYWPTTFASQPLLLSSQLNEDEKHYYLSVELPGMAKENIKIEADKKRLKIFGERKEENKPRENERQHYSEFAYGSFSREYQFREAIQEEKVQAKYENGVLNLTIPKSGESELRKIEVK